VRRPSWPTSLVALTHHEYQCFVVALLLTSIAAQILLVATLWQVFVLTGSAILLGLTGLARAVPQIVLSLVGGVVADRVDRVRLLQITQVGNAVLIFVLAALTFTGTVEVWHVYAVTFFNGALQALSGPARTALIPNLVPREHLMNAIAFNSTVIQLSMVVGPAVGGAIISAFDLFPTYALNGAAYLVSCVALTLVHVPPVPARTRESPWRSLLEGLGFVRERSVILSMLGMDVASQLFGGYRALLPIFAVSLGTGADGLGYLSAAPGVGGFLMATLMLGLGNVRYKGLCTVFGILGYCVALVMLAWAPVFWVALVASALLGCTNSIQAIPRNTAILTMTPDHLRGRVESVRTMLAGGVPPLGYSFSGGLAEVVGASLSLTYGAVACALIVVVMGMWHRELRDPDLGVVRTAPAPEPS
jgi:MFS family permease